MGTLIMESKTFCIYPWDHLATLTNGSIIPCCVAADDQKLNLNQHTFEDAWNSETLRTIRQKMIRGEIPAACTRCFKEESSGIKSHRVQSNQHHKNNMTSFEHLFKMTDPDGYYHGPIRSLDLRLGNNCNLKCVMCRPNESSKWTADAEILARTVKSTHLKSEMKDKLNIDSKNFDWIKNESFWNSLHKLIPDMREMIVAGGEPFIIKEQNKFLNECARRGLSKNLKIRYHTNGTFLTDELIETFKSFKQIEVMVSIDGLDSQNYYMRYPANWTDILKNFQKLDETENHVKIYILSSMHAMSMFYFPELLTWIIQQRFKKIATDISYQKLACTGIVHHPDYLNMQILPLETKNLIRAKFEKFYTTLDSYYADQPQLKTDLIKRLNANIEYMFSADQSKLLPVFTEFVTELDKIRQTSFSETFNELAESLKSSSEVELN
jgi:MoaA/NifB/PqqE/SkfB family radical SAM enzyme